MFALGTIVSLLITFTPPAILSAMRLKGSMPLAPTSHLWPAIPMHQKGTFEWSKCAVKPIHCGQAYYREVLQGFRRAQSSIIIMGWRYEFDQKLFSEENSTAPTLSLRDLVYEAINDPKRPELHIYILFWKNTISEKDWAIGLSITDAVNTLRAMSNKVHVLKDNSRHAVTLLWSAHIKVTIFDRSVGYCGGIDFADTRLDSPEHILPNTERYHMESNVPPQHGYGKPWQDVMVKVEGRVANDLASIAAERWLTWCASVKIKDEDYRQACDKQHLLSPVGVGKLHAKLRENITLEGKVKITVRYGDTDVENTLAEARTTTFSLKRHDLAKRAVVVVKREQSYMHALLNKIGIAPRRMEYAIENVNGLRDPEVDLQWQPFEPSTSSTLDSTCRTLLSGDDMWLGAKDGIMDIFWEHQRMIEEAKTSIYIENQYFGTRFGDAEQGRCAELESKAVNNIGELLNKKITQHALQDKAFSVVIVIPLATEEPETQYPNLRSAQCMYEALTTFWSKNPQIKKPISDYFGIYHLANVVLHEKHPAFYGIFVHSKLIVTDYDSPNGQAIVGSANVNDRSLRRHRDAEVSVAIRGNFKLELMQELLKYHAAFVQLPASQDLAKSLHSIAAENMDSLERLGIQWQSGSVAKWKEGWVPAFNQNKPKPHFDMDEAFKVGSGVHWTILEGEFDEIQTMRGHLLPWNLNLWGDAGAYWHFKHNHPQGAWLQLNQNSTIVDSLSR